MIKELGSIRGIVFMVMAAALCVFTASGIVDSKDFVVLASMCFTSYFTRGRDSQPPVEK